MFLSGVVPAKIMGPKPDERHYRVLVYGLPSPLLGSLLLLLAQSLNTLLLPPLLPGEREHQALLASDRRNLQVQPSLSGRTR